MQKVSITSDASLWAELAKRRHENFCSLFLRVASVESTRIYEKLVAKKVKDTPQACEVSIKWPCTVRLFSGTEQKHYKYSYCFGSELHPALPISC